MIDMHMHSDASDGSLAPEALAVLAEQCGLSAAALTDHDTTAGTRRFVDACTALQIRGIAGVEISADFAPGTMHILGYFLETADSVFEADLERIRAGRNVRNRQMLAVLNDMGMPLDLDEVAALAGGTVTGRPHIAEAMVGRGYVPDRATAFSRYLGKGKPAYCDRYRMGPAEAVAAIVAAGGVAVLAHPCTLQEKPAGLRSILGMLADAGLAGIEVIYPEHAESLRQLYRGLAREYHLVVTGGSDFHGALNPAIRLGLGFGNVRVPDSVLEALEARIPARGAATAPAAFAVERRQEVRR